MKELQIFSISLKMHAAALGGRVQNASEGLNRPRHRVELSVCVLHLFSKLGTTDRQTAAQVRMRTDGDSQ